MIDVVGIVFDDNDKQYFFLPGNFQLKKNITVIVETGHGLEFGRIESVNKQIEEKSLKGPLKSVVRIATKEDYQANKKNKKDALEALEKCRKIANNKNLNMKIIDAKYTFDRDQLVFRFLADSRIDFRELAKELASIYKTRIELRQIGARDKAKEIGGCGQCGRTLCCSKFLNDLDSVSISMAKNQNISLNPNKINGVCGRLLCCLKYEDGEYKECRKCLPKIGSTVKCDKAEGKVVNLDILNKKYSILTKDNIILEEKIK